ncbi:MAG: c-type cytochrome domain-containing protein [Planctomycetaceae bacterium]
MSKTVRCWIICIAALVACSFSGAGDVHGAPLNKDQRKVVSEIKKDLAKVTSLSRAKKFDEAEELIKSAEEKLDNLILEAMLKDDDKIVIGQKKLIEAKRKILDLAKNPDKKKKGNTVSFEEDVAPIIIERCLLCHKAEKPSGGLALDTFAGMKKGSTNGPLLIPGNANQSRLALRVATPDEKLRMPKDGQKLDNEEVQLIALWINQGAKFDGKAEEDKIGSSVKAEEDEEKKEEKPKSMKEEKPVTIEKPTGDETVSFKDDIAPWMVVHCVRCHSGDDPRSGFSLETFEKLMTGGDSGYVIVPTKPEESRIYDLVVTQLPFKMPRGQGLLKEKNAIALTTWIREGAKFDGPDPAAALTSYVPTEEELRAAELAAMSPEQFSQMRNERSKDQWTRAIPKDQPAQIESAEFLLMGNVSEERLKTLNVWAEKEADNLRDIFKETDKPLWKGRLTIFAIKDRFGFEEFNITLHQRTPPAEMLGHAVVTAHQEDAYIVVQDVGDTVTSESPGLHLILAEQMTAALMKRKAANLPGWMVQGAGLAVAARSGEGTEYLEGLKKSIPELLTDVKKPEDIFVDGTFSPSGTAAVGYALVEFLLKSQGGEKFGQLVGRVASGGDVLAALKTVYQAEPAAIAQTFVNGLKISKKR